jgi:hypothetical protein
MILKIGKDIPKQDAADLLFKLIVDRTVVQAVFTGISSLSASVIGVVYPAPDGTAVVKARKKTGTPFLRFDPTAATSFRFADRRASCEDLVAKRRLISALSFSYPDKTHVTLFELRVEEKEQQENGNRQGDHPSLQLVHGPMRASKGSPGQAG